MTATKKTIAPRFSWTQERKNYLLAFGLAFAVLFITLLPIVIQDGGYFIYYGDYNSQQIPFYSLASQAVKSGSFGWNWYTDLGANFIGSYSFYLLGSPFFWIAALLPQSAVIYAMPVLLCLKHGVAALTAYAYIRKFVKNPNAALVGCLIYAFSGFQLFNLFFNHFSDVTAFFPLMLLAMEECVGENRRGVFALMVALMAIINYFFFAGQVVFLVIYFYLRCPCKDFPVNLKKFFILLLEAVIGVLIACMILVPSALTVIENSRVDSFLYGMDMVAYSDRTRIWRILYGLFMIPDSPARPNLFSSDYAKWASIGGYLPLFSMAGVIAFLQQKKGHWAKRLTIVCAICAAIPILNSAFYMFNSSYYARWYYMPILVLAMMTAYALDNAEINWRTGFRACAVFLAAFLVISFLPVKEDGEVEYFSFAKYPAHFYLTWGICVVGLIVAWIFIRRRDQKKRYLRGTIIAVVCAAVACCMSVVYFGAFEQTRAETYIDQAIDAENEISVSVTPTDYFRIDISQDCDNYPMLWGLPSMRAFHSVVPASIMTFYESLGITRDVASRVDTSYYALRGLLSVRYYYQKASSTSADNPTIDLPGFEYETTENGFNRYINEYYIPMGFTFNYYMTQEDWAAVSEDSQSTVMIRALILDDDQAEKYGDILTQLDSSDVDMGQRDYLEECKKRQASACDSFTYDSYGFTATITLDSDNLVFFSVPYESGWSATVNGEDVEIEEVDNGLMAVKCPAGDDEIVFSYETPGLKFGSICTLIGVIALVIYLLICRKVGVRGKAVPGLRIDYEIGAEDRNNAYLIEQAHEQERTRNAPPSVRRRKKKENDTQSNTPTDTPTDIPKAEKEE